MQKPPAEPKTDIGDTQEAPAGTINDPTQLLSRVAELERRVGVLEKHHLETQDTVIGGLSRIYQQMSAFRESVRKRKAHEQPPQESEFVN